MTKVLKQPRKPGEKIGILAVGNGGQHPEVRKDNPRQRGSKRSRISLGQWRTTVAQPCGKQPSRLHHLSSILWRRLAGLSAPRWSSTP